MSKRGEMYSAIMDGDVEVFEKLVSGGMTAAEVTPGERWNLLHQTLLNSMWSPPLHMVKRLIEWGVDVNGVDCYGNTPLHYAVTHETAEAAEIVRLLIHAGAKVNIFNKKMATPLRSSLMQLRFRVEIMRILLEAGADMNQKNKGGLSVREMIERNPASSQELKALFSEFSARPTLQ